MYPHRELGVEGGVGCSWPFGPVRRVIWVTKLGARFVVGLRSGLSRESSQGPANKIYKSGLSQTELSQLLAVACQSRYGL
jgi:hypothetical protein